MHLHFAFWIWQVFAQQQLALLKILVADVLCPCLVVYKRILVLWWWWQWKRWQSTKRGTLAKQMPEWATDKQIVPPHTMIEEHCLQNAEDDTGRDVFCHLVHRMWTILSACCQYKYCRPPNPSTLQKIASQNCWLYLPIPFKKSIFCSIQNLATPPPVPDVVDKHDFNDVCLFPEQNLVA